MLHSAYMQQGSSAQGTPQSFALFTLSSFLNFDLLLKDSGKDG